MKKLLGRVKQFNVAIQVLLIILVILILINIAISDRGNSNNSGSQNGGYGTQASSTTDQGPKNLGVKMNQDAYASPSKYDDVTEDFLRELPVQNEYYYVDYFPLEGSGKPKVVVTLLSIDSREKFDFWLSQFSEVPDVDFFFDTSRQFSEGPLGE